MPHPTMSLDPWLPLRWQREQRTNWRTGVVLAEDTEPRADEVEEDEVSEAEEEVRVSMGLRSRTSWTGCGRGR